MAGIYQYSMDTDAESARLVGGVEGVGQPSGVRETGGLIAIAPSVSSFSGNAATLWTRFDYGFAGVEWRCGSGIAVAPRGWSLGQNSMGLGLWRISGR